MKNLSFIDQMQEEQKRIKALEQIAGKGLMMPYNITNSGPRKLMYSTMIEHMLGLAKPEIALVQTGYENRFGEFTSSYLKADQEYEVIDKIIKFTEDHYFLLIKDKTGTYDVIERISYEHITESYGYLYNNDYLDSLEVGSKIRKGDTVKKSNAYDENDNRQDGINLLSTYLSDEYTKEDSIRISEEASWKLAAPLIKKVPIIINDNDMPLNIYGNDDIYKSFPNIGEEVIDGTICVLRRQKNEEALFSQSVERLKRIMMSDTKFRGRGKVIDINIYCNNEDILNQNHFTQLKYYHNYYKKFLSDFIEMVRPVMESGARCSWNLQKMYYDYSKIIVDGYQYLKDKVFSNTVIEFVLLDLNPVKVGDKISNRFGGKGVVSQILPSDKMPKLDNGETIELIWNASTCVNRENAGQLFETELNNISSRIIEFMNTKVLDFEHSAEMYFKFLSIVDPEQFKIVYGYYETLSVDDQMSFVDSLCKDNGIVVSSRPLTTLMNLDKLNELYQEFPFATQYKMLVPQLDSNNNIRYIPGRRPLTCGRQYIYRLKQYAEEKFSAVSLSSTNIKNENSRSSSKKNNTSAHSRTPIRFGEMETGNLGHLGMENVIINLMIHSASPGGRRLAKELLTGDPFNRNIELDADSKNRSVEILNAYLTTMGLRIVITKKPKKLIKPILRRPVVRLNEGLTNPIVRLNPNQAFDPLEFHNRVINTPKRVIIRHPIKRTRPRKRR